MQPWCVIVWYRNYLRTLAFTVHPFLYVAFVFRNRESSYWQPGEVLPINSENTTYAPESPIPARDNSQLVDFLKDFQADISRRLSDVSEKLQGIDTRMDGLEKRQKCLEDEVHASSSLSSSSTPSPALPNGKRRRVTPTALQVQLHNIIIVTLFSVFSSPFFFLPPTLPSKSKIRMVYLSFDDDKKFILSEP